MTTLIWFDNNQEITRFDKKGQGLTRIKESTTFCTVVPTFYNVNKITLDYLEHQRNMIEKVSSFTVKLECLL